jgi:lipopolysaccharide transport system permease protein
MPKLIIEPGRAERQYWRDLWHYRELFYILAWRDISVRYKQTAIGIIWAVLQPLLVIVIFTAFSKLAKLSSNGVPPPLFICAGALPWQFFSTALTGASASLVGNANLISKVYFPRLIIPAGAVITSFVDFLISFAILIALMFWFHFCPGWRMLMLPLFVLIAFAAALGPGLFITALNVKYRDFRYIIPFIVQFGLYVCPIAWPSSYVYEKFPKWGLLYSLNPMVGVIDGFRWATLGGESQIYLPGFLLSLVVVVLLLVFGIQYFRRTEKSFADVI